jgi:hypothetical protein
MAILSLEKQQKARQCNSCWVARSRPRSLQNSRQMELLPHTEVALFLPLCLIASSANEQQVQTLRCET